MCKKGYVLMTKLNSQSNKKHIDDEILCMQFRIAIEDIQNDRNFDDVNLSIMNSIHIKKLIFRTKYLVLRSLYLLVLNDQMIIVLVLLLKNQVLQVLEINQMKSMTKSMIKVLVLRIIDGLNSFIHN